MRSEEGKVIDTFSGSDEVTAAAPAAGWPKRIGILNDYVRIPHANGSSFASPIFVTASFANAVIA